MKDGRLIYMSDKINIKNDLKTSVVHQKACQFRNPTITYENEK